MIVIFLLIVVFALVIAPTLPLDRLPFFIQTTPTIDPTDMGIVVSYFYPSNSRVDKQYADSVVSDFKSHLETELLKNEPHIGLKFKVLGPENMTSIEGDTIELREENARHLAEATGADIIVYGTIDYNSDGVLTLLPEFYISPRQFWDTLEITGTQRLGAPIPIKGPNADSERETLINRTSAIASIISGLAEYSAEKYSDALPFFNAVSTSAAWEQTQGSEVLNILLGNTYLKLAQQVAFGCNPNYVDRDRKQILQYISLAKGQYESAQQPPHQTFARAFSGLASAYYLQSIWSPTTYDEGCNPSMADPVEYNQASKQVELAEEASDKPTEIGVLRKLDLIKAQIAYLIWYGDTSGSPNVENVRTILNPTDTIIQAYDNGKVPELTLLAVEAHVLRGTVYLQEGKCFDAIPEYNTVLDMKEIASDRRMFVTGWRAYCYEELHNLPTAAAAYDAARQLATSIGHEEDANAYEAARDDVIATITAEVP